MIRCGNNLYKVLKECSLRREFSQATTPHQEALMRRGLPKKAPLPGVDEIVVVASGKGGVGKSTISVNLAVALSSLGKRVGLLDADIFGPSIPLMMNLHEKPLVDDENKIIPPINYGVKCLSMGLLTEKQDAIIWRGPLVMSALQRLLKGTNWGPLDILIVDTPPGTGDVHISLAQNVPISGVLLVSTPQKNALEVTLRGLKMYQTLGVKILGLTENMGHTICTNCQNRLEFFRNTTQDFLQTNNLALLATVPLNATITTACDEGIPVVVQQGPTESAEGKIFKELAKNILSQLEEKQKSEKIT